MLGYGQANVEKDPKRSIWYQLLGVVLAAFILWLLYSRLKGQPDLLNSADLGKSSYTMAILALVLIAFVALCVMLLKAG